MRISDWSSDVCSSDLRTTAADPAAPLATPTEDGLPRRWADFATLGEALDYAATGARGFNFHDPRGALLRAYPFAEMRRDAHDCAYRLIARRIAPGDRIALVAEPGPEFAALSFGEVYSSEARRV